MEGRTGNSSGRCKIRKRGCSSSSSSSLARRYRLKRTILVGKRTGSSTQVPTWKFDSKSPALLVRSRSSYSVGTMGEAMGRDVSVSARKLGATLWEINEVPSPVKEMALNEKKGTRKREKSGKVSHSESRTMSRLSDPTYNPFPEGIDQHKGGRHRRRASAISPTLQLTDYIGRGLGGRQEDSVTRASLIEMESHSRSKNRAVALNDMRTLLKDLINSLMTSKELLKVLHRVGGFEKQQPSAVSLVFALRAELDQAQSHAEELIHESRADWSEIEFLSWHFAEEKTAWKAKERERVRNAVAHMAEELEAERQHRKQTERLNKKLGKELWETKASLSKAVKELESERRSKEILEQVCDELARGIGEDKAEVERLKRESGKVLEEVEKEREMLQLADVLREERVQMKLSEAKYHFEEKNAAVERLRSELECYLKSVMGKEEENEDTSKLGRSKTLEALLMGNHNNGDLFDLCHYGEATGEMEEGEGGDSADSDLQSIELNMDSNTRSFKWSFGDDIKSVDHSKKDSLDRELPFNGRRSLSEKIQWASISLMRGTSSCSDLEPELDSRKNLDGFDRRRLLESISYAQGKNEEEEESKRYSSTKGLKDSKEPSSSFQPAASLIRRWSPVQDPVRDIRESLPATDAKAEAMRIGSEHGNDPIEIET